MQRKKLTSALAVVAVSVTACGSATTGGAEFSPATLAGLIQNMDKVQDSAVVAMADFYECKGKSDPAPAKCLGHYKTAIAKWDETQRLAQSGLNYVKGSNLRRSEALKKIEAFEGLIDSVGNLKTMMVKDAGQGGAQ